MAFKPSRRLLVFVVVVLAVLAAPVGFAAFWVVRQVFTPPVSGTRFLDYDGVNLNWTCSDRDSSKGGQVLICDGTLRVDSRFAVVDHDATAVGWCVQQLNEAHFENVPPQKLGPLQVGTLPVVAPDWGDCADVVPRRAGLYFELIIPH